MTEAAATRRKNKSSAPNRTIKEKNGEAETFLLFSGKSIKLCATQSDVSLLTASEVLYVTISLGIILSKSLLYFIFCFV